MKHLGKGIWLGFIGTSVFALTGIFLFGEPAVEEWMLGSLYGIGYAAGFWLAKVTK